MASSSSFRATHLPDSYLANLPPDSEISMSTLVAEQDRLADEAREAMPYAFDECTYGRGYLRQSVWSCIDCGSRGVCYGCSISCHSDHKLVELWTRRHFRCDCPTTCMQPEPSASALPGSTSAKRRRCTLNPPQIQPAEDNSENRYNKNYKGEFCRCGREYDPLVETEGMLCCIGCEDWFHESCLNLRPLQPPTVDPEESSVKAYPQPDQAGIDVPTSTATPIGAMAVPAENQGADEEDDDDEAGILIPSESYDGLICAACVADHPALSSRVGKEGWMTIVPDGKGGYEVKGRPVQLKEADGKATSPLPEGEATSTGEAEDGTVEQTRKRRMAESLMPGDAKRIKLDDVGEQTVSGKTGKGDVFLVEGEREKLKLELDAESTKALPFPLDDEEIYEPRKDDDKEETLDEVTARVVDNLPRAQAIEAVQGYQRLKDRLQSMLSTHALNGRVVSRDDIEEMFRELRGAAN